METGEWEVGDTGIRSESDWTGCAHGEVRRLVSLEADVERRGRNETRTREEDERREGRGKRSAGRY